MKIVSFSASAAPRLLAPAATCRARLAGYDVGGLAAAAKAQGGRSGIACLVRPRALLELMAHRAPTDQFELSFVCDPLAWRLEVAATFENGNGLAAEQRLSAMLRIIAPHVRFKFIATDAGHDPSVVLAPRPCPALGADDASIWLPSPDWGESDLTNMLGLAHRLGVARVSFSIRSLALTSEARAQLAAAHYRLGEPRHASAFAEAQRSVIGAWLNMGRGTALTATVSCPRPLSPSDVELLSVALFGSTGDSEPRAALDLRLAFPSGMLPPWRFWPAPGDLRRHPPSEPSISEKAGAVTLGLDAAGDPVRLSGEDRMRHLFVIGSTGSGKTTLIARMIGEDIANGEGVMLIDPHGDLAETVRDAIPRRRRKDLVWIDVGEETQDWRLDLLHTSGIYPATARNRVANQLVAFFKQIYAGTPEAFGPAFEMFFRNTIFLLCSAKTPEDRSLLKFEDVLTNRKFRARLLEECDDPKVVEFWNELAEEICGEWKLENMAPYIACKMNQISGSPLTRNLIGGSQPRLDIRAAMDERKIVVVRLSKGLIGEYDARFVGALFLMALVEAAMGRYTRGTKRTPFRVYVDEFQTLASDIATIMLAECRKYGLSLTLANQSLGQLDCGWFSSAKVAHAALTNCGSLAVFRTSLTDAKAMAPMLDLETHDEFLGLSVGEMLARRLVRGAPAAAERLSGLPPLG